MPDAGPQQKRPNDPGKRNYKGGHACLAHAVDIGLDACNEHQHETTQLSEQHERPGCLPSLKQMQMQQIEGTRAQHYTDQQFRQNSRDPESAAERGSDFPSRDQYGHQQRELKCRLHCYLMFAVAKDSLRSRVHSRRKKLTKCHGPL